jgi:hypothetical protein
MISIIKNKKQIIALVLLPIIVKIHLLFSILYQNPIYVWSGLATTSRGRVLPGFSTIDPNIATVSQTLGHAAAQEILNGHIPWWNFYQGVGGPLAGEMQSAALFPFTLLLYLPQGQLYMHIVLQIVAGLSTFFLLRRLGFSLSAAAFAGILFEFNGTFSWLANAVINPIAFLPLILLGVESVRARILSLRGGGWWWISIGLALSLYAGFPEVAYLNGLLIACWTLARLPGMPRAQARKFLFHTAAGVTSGLLLSAPILIAFFDFLQDAYVGQHDGGGYLNAHLPYDSLLGIPLPYAFGFIFQGDAAFTPPFWSNVGGYAGIALLALGICGALGARYRALRLTLAGWVLLCLTATYGVPGAARLLLLIPAVNLSAFFRYLPPSWEFALAVLAGFAIDDLAGSAARKGIRAYWIGLAGVAAVVGGAILVLAVHSPVTPLPRWFHNTIVQSLALGVLIFLALGVVGIYPMRPGRRARIVAYICAGEAILYFFLPTLSNPSHVQLALGAVEYLKADLGVQRFFTLGPIQPNYGAYFGIASLDHTDLPIPKGWADYVTTTLDPNTDPIGFNAINRQDPSGPTAADNLVKNLDEFKETGVKHVVTQAGYDPFGWTGEAPPPERSGDSFIDLSDTAVATIPMPQPGMIVTGAAVYVRNSRDMAGGSLSIKICSGDICGEGKRDLAESLDNNPFMVPLAQPISGLSAPLTITFRQLDANKPVALGTYASGPGSTQTLMVNGKPVEGRELRAVVEQGGPHVPKRVYSDKAITIYELPDFQPYFTAAGCTLQTVSRNKVIADCPAPSKLLRLEYFAKGWDVFVDGRKQTVGRTGRIFQEADIPAGRSSITFSFTPEFMTAGYVAFAAGIVLAMLGIGRSNRLANTR